MKIWNVIHESLESVGTKVTCVVISLRINCCNGGTWSGLVTRVQPAGGHTTNDLRNVLGMVLIT